MLKLLIFILFIFTIINPAYSTSVSPTQLNIANVTNFPHEIETKFIINFNSNSSHERNNQIYLIIKDGKKVKEKLLINLGSNLNYTNKSKYFETISISQNNQLKIRFSKYSQGKVLEIRQNLNDKTNFKSSKKLFRDFVDLIFQPKLNLTSNIFNSTRQYESSIEFGMEPTDQSLMSNIAGELKDHKEINKKQNDLLSQITKTLKSHEKKFVYVMNLIKRNHGNVYVKMSMHLVKTKFIQIKWKVSKPTIKQITGKFIDCADLADNNEIFGFQYKNSKCILYPTFDYCDNNLKYEVETIYARKSEWNKISSSAAYQILRNVSNIFINRNLYWNIEIKLDKKKKTKSILKVGNKTILAVSTELGIRAAAIGIYPSYNDTRIMNNLAKWLTRGRCANFFSCKFGLHEKDKYLNSSGVIFKLINYHQRIDADIYNKIESGDWAVIFYGTHNNVKYNKMSIKYGFTMDNTSYKEQNIKMPDYTC